MLEAMATTIWEARDLEWDQDWEVACFGLGVDLLQGFKVEAGIGGSEEAGDEVVVEEILTETH